MVSETSLRLTTAHLTRAGTQTCRGYPGSLGYEDIDASAWAEWGVDCKSESSSLALWHWERCLERRLTQQRRKMSNMTTAMSPKNGWTCPTCTLTTGDPPTARCPLGTTGPRRTAPKDTSAWATPCCHKTAPSNTRYASGAMPMWSHGGTTPATAGACTATSTRPGPGRTSIAWR